MVFFNCNAVKDVTLIPNGDMILLNEDKIKIIANSFKDVDSITIFNVQNQIQSVSKYICEKYYTYNCRVNTFNYIPNSKRNIRKYINNLVIKKVKSFKDYREILSLGNKKVVRLDSDIVLDRQSRYLKENQANIISYAIIAEEKIISGIICRVINNTVEMICCNYDSNYIRLNLNDILYFKIIEWSKQNGIVNINWGNVSEYDDGLMRFKKKYSNVVDVAYLYHVFKKSSN